MKKIIKWTLLTVLSVWGTMSFLLLGGEKNPESPLSTGEFFLIKCLALLSLILCYQIGKVLNKAGYLPELDKNESHDTSGFER